MATVEKNGQLYDQIFELPPVRSLFAVRLEGQAFNTMFAVAKSGAVFRYCPPGHKGYKADAPDNSMWVRVATAVKDGTSRYPKYDEGTRPSGSPRRKAGENSLAKAGKGGKMPHKHSHAGGGAATVDPHGD